MDHERSNSHLSDHTISMRKALIYCQELVASARPLCPSTREGKAALEDAREAARSLQNHREKALCECNGQMEVPVLDTMPPPPEFRRAYLHANRPCKIIDKAWCQEHFSRVLSSWKDNSNQVNRSWFIERLGKETVVPVRHQQNHAEEVVDQDGRAFECETKRMTLLEWLITLDAKDDSFYLKDWHLQSWLEEHYPGEERLYNVPEHFQKDLLNNLLLRFTKGDYRFTYWGPDGSRTGLHSDVLNSFSWSFNVHGIKEWTFYVPCIEGNSVESCSGTIMVKQHAGECIFVPAGWKHTVANIGETISINHNWITTANLDLTWQIIDAEILAVDKELLSWGGHITADWESKESMLLGCIGLNVTAFVSMILTGLLELLQSERDESWEHYFDAVRLGDMLRLLHQNERINPSARLRASLADDSLEPMVALVVEATLNLLD